MINQLLWLLPWNLTLDWFSLKWNSQVWVVSYQASGYDAFQQRSRLFSAGRIENILSGSRLFACIDAMCFTNLQRACLHHNPLQPWLKWCLGLLLSSGPWQLYQLYSTGSIGSILLVLSALFYRFYQLYSTLSVDFSLSSGLEDVEPRWAVSTSPRSSL